jgi:hypothetical protein
MVEIIAAAYKLYSRIAFLTRFDEAPRGKAERIFPRLNWAKFEFMQKDFLSFAKLQIS